MANIKSQEKRNIQNQKLRIQNMQKRSKLRTLIKKYKLAAINKDENIVTLKNELVSYIDNCQAKGIITKNSANRKKSQIMKLT